MVCLWPVLGPKTTPGRAGIAGKISSGGVLGRLGVAALRSLSLLAQSWASSGLIFGPSWVDFGPPWVLLGRFLGQLGSVLVSKMALALDFGPVLTTWELQANSR